MKLDCNPPIEDVVRYFRRVLLERSKRREEGRKRTKRKRVVVMNKRSEKRV